MIDDLKVSVRLREFCLLSFLMKALNINPELSIQILPFPLAFQSYQHLPASELGTCITMAETVGLPSDWAVPCGPKEKFDVCVQVFLCEMEASKGDLLYNQQVLWALPKLLSH